MFISHNLPDVYIFQMFTSHDRQDVYIARSARYLHHSRSSSCQQNWL